MHTCCQKNAGTTSARCSLVGSLLLFELKKGGAVVRKLSVMSGKTCFVVCFCTPQNIVKCKIAGVNNSLKRGTRRRGHLQVNTLVHAMPIQPKYYILLQYAVWSNSRGYSCSFHTSVPLRYQLCPSYDKTRFPSAFAHLNRMGIS